MPIADEFNFDVNRGSFGKFGSHTQYDPSARNKVGNEGQWWTQPPALAAQQAGVAAQQAQQAQQLSNPVGQYTERDVPWTYDRVNYIHLDTRPL